MTTPVKPDAAREDERFVEGFYDRYWRSDEGPIREQVFREWWDPAYRTLGDWIAQAKRARILVVGCGLGAELVRFGGEGRQIVGVDVSVAALARARQHGEVARAQAEALPFADGAFDVVFISNALMFTQREAALAEARRVCGPDGQVLLLEPMRRPLVVRWLRKLEPFARHSVYWEPADLAAFRQPDERAEMQVHFLFSPLWMGLWRHRPPPRWAARVRDALVGLDRALLDFVPFLERWAFLAAIRYRSEPAEDCPVCGRALEPDCVWHDVRGFRFLECACGAASLSPLPQAELEEHYGDDYWKGDYGYADYEADRDIHEKNFANVLDWIEATRPTGRQGRWLEVGGGPGFFSALARKRGFDVRLVERSPWAVRRARALLGEEAVHEGEVSQLEASDERYDVIVLHDVLEHVPAPREALAKLRELLAESGVLYLDFWDRNAAVARGLGRGWHAIDPPDHLIHYEPRAIDALARSVGLRSVGSRSSGRRLALRAAIGKLLPPALVDRLPRSVGARAVKVDLGDLRQCLFERGEQPPASERGKG